MPASRKNTTTSKTIKTAKRVTAKSDPAAAKLAEDTRALARAAGMTSGYTAGEAREVIDNFTVINKRGTLTITRQGQEPVKVKATVLRKFADGADRNEADMPETAKLLAALAKDCKSMLYGRKLAFFLLNRPGVREVA